MVFLMAWLIGKAPWTTNFIGSVSRDQSRARVGTIKETIEINPRFKNVFPHVHMDYSKPLTVDQFSVWSERWGNSPNLIDHKIYRSLITRYGEPKDATLFGAGAGSSAVVGKRFSGMSLIDDPHDAKNSASEDLRRKAGLWFDGTFLPCVKESGKVAVITTRWAETDLAGQIMNKLRFSGDKIWDVLDIPAILPNGDSYWPEEWPLSRLMAKEEEVGIIVFELMYKNNPLGLSDGEFTLDMLRKDLPNPLPEIKDITISLDLAATDRTYSDYCVFTAHARDMAKPYNVYILDAVREKFAFATVLDQVAAFSDKIFDEYGRLDAVLFEKQSFQSGWSQELESRRADLPVQVVPIKGDKTTRLKAVALKAQSGRMFINQMIPSLPAMQSELIAFPKAQHDDYPDSLSLPFQYWGIGEQDSGIIVVKSDKLK